MSGNNQCEQCGATVRPGAKFCPACGAVIEPDAPVNTGVPAPSQEAPPEYEMPTVVIPRRAGMGWNFLIIGVLLAAALLGTVYHWAATPAPTGQTAAIANNRKALIGQVQLSAALNDDKTPKAPTQVFLPDTTTIYCTFVLKPGAQNAVVKAQWIAEDVGPTTPLDQVLREVKYTAPASINAQNDRGQLSITRTANAWNVGKYRVDLYVNGHKSASVPFEISTQVAEKETTPPERPKRTAASRHKSSSPATLFPLFSPGSERLYEPKAIAVPARLNQSAVETVLRNAMNKVGWNPHPKGAGHLEGRFYLFGSRATIDVYYNSHAVTIRYRASHKLDYRRTRRGPSINKLYNSWVRELEHEIRTRFDEH